MFSRANKTVVRAPEVAIGAVFLSSAILKIIDPLFFTKVFLSPIYLAAIIFDVLVSFALLLRSGRAAKYIVLSVLFSYLVFHFFYPSETCDCLGTYRTPTWAVLWFLISAVIIVATKQFSTETQESRIQTNCARSLLYIGSVCGLLIGTAIVTFLRPGLAIFVEISPSGYIANGYYNGEISIRNTSGRDLKVLGSGRAKCEGLIGISSPVFLRDNEVTELPCILPCDKTGLFLTGQVPINIECAKGVETIIARWAALRPR